MAIKGVPGLSPEWYIPEVEREAMEVAEREGQLYESARFRIRSLTPPELESVMEFTAGGFGVPPRNYTAVLRLGLLGWERFEDPDTGRDYKISLSNHNKIPSDIRMDLAGEIVQRSRQTEDESGNS